MPTTNLPTMSITRLTAAASIAAPRANVRDPMAIALGLPALSERAPAKRDASVADSSTEETTKPSNDGDISPKLVVKDGMAVTGPIVPVSSLLPPFDMS